MDYSFFRFFICSSLLFSQIVLKAQIQKGNDIDGENAGDQSGWSVSMPNMNIVAIGDYQSNANGNISGQARIFRWNGSSWNQKGTAIIGESSLDFSGSSISMPDSNTVAIGARNNGGTGHVRIHRWNGSSWVQKGGDLDGENGLDNFGWSVTMPDSNTVAVGAPNNGGNGTRSGHVRVFKWNGNTWIQKGFDIDGEAVFDYSGRSVSMPDSNTVAIGAYQNDGGGPVSGHVRIYSWNGNSWVKKGGDIDGESISDFSGQSVSMPDSNTVAIGANGNDDAGTNSGHVRVYTWNGISWTKKGGDIDGEASNDFSGYSVSMFNANTLAIGAPYNQGSNAGHGRIYKWNGSQWIQRGGDIDGEGGTDYSGWSISMPSENVVAIGAYGNNDGGSDAGHVRIYEICPIDTNIYVDTIVTCNSYQWVNGITYTSSNQTAIDTLLNLMGCDSIVTLNLTINNSDTVTDLIIACNSYTWTNGITYTGSNNTAIDTFSNIFGCDSIVFLNLLINYSDTLTDSIVACDNYTWINGINYSSTNDSSYVVYTNAQGCDSIIFLNLSIHSSESTIDSIVSCDNYTWTDGIKYTLSNNTAVDTFSNQMGCDSIVFLNLLIHYSDSLVDSIDACTSYTWLDGLQYSSSNNSASHTLPNKNGCDSTIFLNLTINNINSNVIQSGIVLMAEDSTATYQWINCQGNVTIPGATSRTFMASSNGDYAVIISKNGCSDTSSCNSVMGIGIFKNVFGKAVSIFPNPTSGWLHIDFGEVVNPIIIFITDQNGKQVFKKTIEQSNSLKLKFDGPPGIYILTIESEGEKVHSKILKK